MPPPNPLDLSNEAPVESANRDDSLEVAAGVDVVRHVAVRTPPFLKHSPEAWFIQLESVFACHQISSDLQRYHAAVAGLDSETVQDLLDVLQNAPASGKYANLKDQVIHRYGDSATQRLHKLFSGLTMEDRTPSQLLRRMRGLAGNSVSDDAIKVHWLDLLPIGTSKMLRLLRTATLDELAQTADELVETAPEVCSVQRPLPELSIPATTFPSQDNAVAAELAALRAAISQLVVTTSRILERLTARGGRSRARSSGHSTSRAASSSGAAIASNPSWCYYHQRFQGAAERCRPPCTYPANRSTN
ncbi:uncharacterized protein LOC131671502 [Phymastichus coffea]|uniref:uncharacterized protein LOC131671502 n=1 Tax=Phymastichus coffea TaxID=108790 RepID=UPI00273C2060|nr:uncharacterized protein LOC131671502 [Phymastichus coffea]